MKLDMVPVGRITGVHGIRGELRVLPRAGEADFLTGFQKIGRASWRERVFRAV